MPKKLLVPFAILAMASSNSLHAQTSTEIPGVWRADDGSYTVRVAPCAVKTQWCATVIDERLKPGEPSMLNQMIVRDMRPARKNSWSGKYVVDGQSMKASAKLTGANALSFKVCAFAFLCETTRLKRIGN